MKVSIYLKIFLKKNGITAYKNRQEKNDFFLLCVVINCTIVCDQQLL